MLQEQITKANGCVDAQAADLCRMSDAIFDHPEIGPNEVFASGLLTDYLQAHGFRWKRVWAACLQLSGPSGRTGKEDRIWAFCANMMPCPVWAMAAAIRCRGRASWGLL